MNNRESIAKIIASRHELIRGVKFDPRKVEVEGGCGVIGMASSERVAGKHLLRALTQMRNRGNGKGGGVAMVGLDPVQFGVTDQVMQENYFLNIAYIDPSSRAEVERRFIKPKFVTHGVYKFDIDKSKTFEVDPPAVVGYFASPRASSLEDFSQTNGFSELEKDQLEDEFVYQNTFNLNRQFYASEGEKKAFVLSHGKDLTALKMVGFGDDVIRAYQLEEKLAHVWIGHHRYPTKGRVWHPGGAHPFAGMHEQLVHNGDFANYSSLVNYLKQKNIVPLYLTDTEVAALFFDLLNRTYEYPLEYTIEALAPTTERDFTLLPAEKQFTYEAIQKTHIHGSPDGPWFFLIAQSLKNGSSIRSSRLIGITDTSMLRPQVFALQEGAPEGPSIGFAASEKQAIDAALLSLSNSDSRFWTRADKYWNARGGSFENGGAFIFEVVRDNEKNSLVCTDKFSKVVSINENSPPCGPGYDETNSFLEKLVDSATDDLGRMMSIQTITELIDRPFKTENMRRSSLLSLYDQSIEKIFRNIFKNSSKLYLFHQAGKEIIAPERENQILVLEASGFESEGESSLAGELTRLYQANWRKFIIFGATGQRFIGAGIGPDSQKLKIDVYGSSGDYLASGLDGGEIVVHRSGQDQLAQIMSSGKLVVYGDVGQTFGYGAKGGNAYILGNAAGRPMINAVGKPKVVINGTCLDYLAESFMAGDPLDGGGFIIVNGLRFDETGKFVELDTPYPGGNLFSLASGGAIYIRDPRRVVSAEQLNGGSFAKFAIRDWQVIKPHLQENEKLFGIKLNELLTVDGDRWSAHKVYRKINPGGEGNAEAQWVRGRNSR